MRPGEEVRDVFGEEFGASLGWRLTRAVPVGELDDGPLGELGDPNDDWPEPLSTAEHAVTIRASTAPAAPWRTLRIGTAQLSQADLRSRIARV